MKKRKKDYRSGLAMWMFLLIASAISQIIFMHNIDLSFNVKNMKAQGYLKDVEVTDSMFYGQHSLDVIYVYSFYGLIVNYIFTICCVGMSMYNYHKLEMTRWNR